MLFNSLEFLAFLPIVFALYWSLGHRAQNAILLAASYVFYGFWDWRFLSLIAVSSCVDYVAGLRIAAAETQADRRRWLVASLITNLGTLAAFKYFDFFVDGFAAVLRALGFQANIPTLAIVLPVGISFYTFQTMSYSIDVFRRLCAPHRSVLEFFAFVSFFPQLVAGPIERARNLLGQFAGKRHFDPSRAADGCRQMLWGMFKKVVIADNLAEHVDAAFAGGVTGIAFCAATVLFAFQIYCDFSGYSDIAEGCARLFGFSLMRNFAYPYFSTSVAEFWKRWHISLSSWFGDYVYIPLGGNRLGGMRRLWNILVTFVLSGFWHGANWTFIVWGLLHALFYIPTVLLRIRPLAAPAPAVLSAVVKPLKMAATFAAVCVAWVFFRADSLTHAATLLRGASAGSWLPADAIYGGAKSWALVGVLVVAEAHGRHRQHPLALDTWPAPARWAAYYVVVGLIFFAGKFTDTPFIYFQF